MIKKLSSSTRASLGKVSPAMSNLSNLTINMNINTNANNTSKNN
jgi:hypothetical protein